MLNSNDTCVSTGTPIKDTGFGYTMSVIGGKYKLIILHLLAENEAIHYNELHRRIGTKH